jgi:hypothetical protein
MRRTTAKSTTRQPRAHADPHPALPLEPSEPAPLASAVDVHACFEHLLAAVDALARTGGSPPEVMHALDALRAILGKES